MLDPISFYAGLKFWLPLVSAFAIVIKAYTSMKKNVSAWADALLNNHLSHIESATTSTHTETIKTNTLLASAALNDIVVAQKVADTRIAMDTHNEKQQQVWQGVLNTLTILEDRTRRGTRATPKKRRR